MSKIDVEMEDAEKLHDDPGNNIQKSECKVIDPKVESKKEVPCEAAVSRDLNGRGNGEENLNKVIDEKVEDKMDVKTEVVDQTNSVNEVSEPIQGSDCGTMIAKSENKELTNTGTMAEAQTAASDNKELINTKTAAEAQTAATGAAEKQSNVKLEVVECDATDSEAKEDEPAKNDMVDGNHGEDVEKRSNEDVGVNFEVVECDATDSGLKEDEPAKNDVLDGNQEENVDEDIVEKPGEIGKDTDDTEHVADEMMVENADAGNVPSQNRQLPTESLLEKRPYEDVVEKKPGEIGKDTDDTEPVAGEMMVENADAGNVPSQNRQLPTESLLEKRPNEDVEEKPGEISKDTDDTEPVAGQMMVENADAGNVPSQNRRLPTEFFANKDPQGQDAEVGDVRLGEDEEMEDTVHFDQDKMVKDKEQGAESFLVSHETDGNEKTFETAAKPDAEESSLASQHEPFTPNSLVRCSSAKTADHRVETSQTVSTRAALPFMGDDDDRTPEDQAAFMKELEHFYKEMTMEFKLPKFYGQPLNCLKLWRAVLRLGGYDRVTGSKLWRQVGESFHPPKTCTTVSWTFRIFYEKSLLEYERHKTQSGELQLPVVMLPEISGADGEGNGHQGSGPGPGRARRDAAARAMQGWHAQRLGAGEVGEPIIKEKNLNNMAKNEKNLKSIGSLKQKRPNEAEHSSKAPRTDTSKRLVTSVVDVGPPADWVKINVRQTKECFEVYALVPGLLREEVRVQSDPAGRLVITGQPEQVDNPWGITPFKKVISLPARIEPVQTSAVVSLHGRLFVRVPLEQPNI